MEGNTDDYRNILPVRSASPTQTAARETTHDTTRAAIIARIVVFGLIALIYLLRLGFGTLWDNSEPTYGEIVKELVRGGDWVTLHFDYQPWFVHPPLWFWTAAVSVMIFGLNEFALRLPSAIFGILTAYAIFRAGQRMYGETAGLIAALVFGTSLELIVLSRLAILDSMLLFFMTVSTMWIYFAVEFGDRRAFWYAIAAAALGTLTKGPVAVALPLLTLVVYWLWSRKRTSIAALPWIAGTVAYFALAGSWFAAETILHGGKFLTAYFGLSTFGRYVSPFENQPGPIWYYLPVAAVGLFPYIAFLPKALKVAWQARGDAERYLLFAAAVPFIFFSLAQTKLPNYIAAMFPACAILVGRVFRDALAGNNIRMLRGALIFLPAALLLLAAVIVAYGETQNAGPFHALAPALGVLGWIVIPLALATLLLTLSLRRVWIAPAGLSLMMLGFLCALAFFILPRVEAFKPMKAFAAKVVAHFEPGDKIGITGVAGGFSLLFYSDDHRVTFVGFAHADERPEAFFHEPGRVLCVILPNDVEGLREVGIRVWVLERAPKMWLVTNQPPGSGSNS